MLVVAHILAILGVYSLIVGTVVREIGPCADQTTKVLILCQYVSKNGTHSEHDVPSDTCRPSTVGQDVDRDLGVAETSERERSTDGQEDSSITDVRLRGAEEHCVSDNGEGSAENEQREALVDLARDEGDNEVDDKANDIRRHSVQLLADRRGVGVDGRNDGGREERNALHGNVDKDEDPRDGQRVGVDDSADSLGLVELVRDLGRADVLRLYARDGQVLLLLREPLGLVRVVRKSEKGDEGDANGDEPLDEEELLPALDAADSLALENARCQQTTEGTSERGRAEVEGQAERELVLPVPAGQVVGNACRSVRV